jgi:hypothetical protein
MNELPFFPFTIPTYSEKIILPQQNTEYKTLTMEKDITLEKEKTIEINIDPKRLTDRKDKQKIAYNIKELKNIAKYLNIKGANTMNKENLVKYIKLKIKK